MGALLCLGTGCSPGEWGYLAAPWPLPGVERAMQTPGFWIDRHPCPDRVALTREAIDLLNAYIRDDLELTRDITLVPSCPGEAVIQALTEEQDRLEEKDLYLGDGTRADPAFYKKMNKKMALDQVPEKVIPRYGFVVHYANQRLLPTGGGLFSGPEAGPFDRLQNSGLDLGTPLAVLHQSRDKNWLYGHGPSSSGWVRAGKVALCSKKALEDALHCPSFVVVTAAKADIYLDPDLTQHYDHARMGVRLPLKGEGARAFEVMVPLRGRDGSLVQGRGYIKRTGARKGYLPFTARHILEQAFAGLHEPYGWGGRTGEQDCSRFMKEVFATVGLCLPRNSADQGRIGGLIMEVPEGASAEEKLHILSRKALGGLTLLYLKGHIMLFTGMKEGRPYAIHATWGYPERFWFGDQTRVINRVEVTDLFLGQGSGRGSLLERVISARSFGAL